MTNSSFHSYSNDIIAHLLSLHLYRAMMASQVYMELLENEEILSVIPVSARAQLILCVSLSLRVLMVDLVVQELRGDQGASGRNGSPGRPGKDGLDGSDGGPGSAGNPGAPVSSYSSVLFY